MRKKIELSRRVYQLCVNIREKRPLVHVVTNFVVMNQTANALLALGASPTMSWARQDTAYMSKISDALCVNMGTPVEDRVEVMKDLMVAAQELGKPVVLDPVGSGAGPYRTGIAQELNGLAPDKIIRGNGSEICSLAGGRLTTRGVESGVSPDQAREILVRHGRTDQPADKIPAGADTLLKSASALVISGSTDMVLGQGQTALISNGCSLMGAVTGTGCILSSLIAAFYSVADNGFEASWAAVSVAGIAGELAAEKSNGPGFFMGHFLDSLYNLDEKTIAAHLNLEIQELSRSKA
ncbi:hydroxyethylthiazole kinase [Desulfospira joergensenii]|uniref:hydroxyethylthiazole kinase n=1 Tax=Desulfospira joergensenii TaxID=53329 RepID=UPI0003B6B901|nr:hydroxyethylthiazole kinase [Desulfospira joergensenii]